MRNVSISNLLCCLLVYRLQKKSFCNVKSHFFLLRYHFDSDDIVLYESCIEISGSVTFLHSLKIKYFKGWNIRNF